MLARKLGWDAPVALLATTIARPSSRSAGQPAAPGRRRLAAPLRHGRTRWPPGTLWSCRAICLADRQAVERRAKIAGQGGRAGHRNVARRRRRVAGAAAKAARLSDRAAGVCSIG